MMTMNDQETISSRASLDIDRIEEPHHDDDLDTSSSTSESTSIISNPLPQDINRLCERILDLASKRLPRASQPLWHGVTNGEQENQQLSLLVARTILFPLLRGCIHLSRTFLTIGYGASAVFQAFSHAMQTKLIQRSEQPSSFELDQCSLDDHILLVCKYQRHTTLEFYSPQLIAQRNHLRSINNTTSIGDSAIYKR